MIDITYNIYASKGGAFMNKHESNANKHWANAEVARIEKLTQQNTPTRIIALKLERTENAVRSKASDEGISLKPTNQSPYNRRKP
jgi:hypothetical protein